MPATTSGARPPAATSSPPASKQVVHDIRFGVVGFAVWTASAVKIYPMMNGVETLQLAAGAAAVALLAIALPRLRPHTYQRWRVPAQAFLRFFLICMPINHNPTVFDVLAPGVATGRLAWALNFSNLLQGTHLMLLLFPALGWRLPLRAHMVVQAGLVVWLTRFSLSVHTHSKLFTDPILIAAVGRMHRATAALAVSVMPFAAAVTSLGPSAQVATAILFMWIVLGFLLPALILMLPELAVRQAQHRQRRQGQRQGPGHLQHSSALGRAKAAAMASLDWLATCVEDWLETLLVCQPACVQARRDSSPPSDTGADAHASEDWEVGWDDPPPLHVSPICVLLVRWCIALLGIWLFCCMVAPLALPPSPLASGPPIL